MKKHPSQVVREAVAEYSARTDKLSNRERQRMLAILERVKRMTVHLDTSPLIDALAGPRPLLGAADGSHRTRDRPVTSTIALYEWLRGPRARVDLVLQEDLFPRAEAVPFGVLEADMAAKLHAKVRLARERELDIAIAACAIVHGGALWTLNRDDFKDIPDLRSSDL